MFGRHVDIGGRRLYLESMGAGTPSVVFESGSEDGAASLRDVALAVQHVTHAICYDRAGVDQSDPAPIPRTSRDIAHDLRRLLDTAAVAPPYLLVGHSIAGLHLRVYAHLYPADVAGLVLLDAAHPDQWQRELGLLPAPAANEPAAITAMRQTIIAEWEDPTTNTEGLDVAGSAAQVRAAGALGDLPLVVITAGIDTWEEGVPVAIAAELARDWRQLQQELVALSTRSRQVLATESDHSIQDCQPELVVAEICRLVELVRASAHGDRPAGQGGSSNLP